MSYPRRIKDSLDPAKDELESRTQEVWNGLEMGIGFWRCVGSILFGLAGFRCGSCGEWRFFCFDVGISLAFDGCAMHGE